MDAGSVLAAVAMGFLGGVSGGLLGVGGGILFVPALVFFLDLSQVSGESTSLLAIVPVALLGAWRQRGYGNVRLRDGMWIGVLSLPGVALGTALANALSERTLKLFFAALLIVLAIGLARRALRRVDD
ncbi:MAG: sulfite exporter TauE/SafE family protein [Actinobacteria bacterium]|nr:MAG: sulfite exporter TauE/SafE family protein [Actinomycetota bacterium]